MLDLSESEPWWKICTLGDTDEERIERTRRTVKWWDRWRWWLLVLCAGMFCLEVTFLLLIDDLLRDHQALLGQQGRGILALVAVAFGFKFGFALQMAVSGLYRCLDNLRTERLLLRLAEKSSRSSP